MPLTKTTITSKKYYIPGGWCMSFSPSRNRQQSMAIVKQNGRYPEKGFSLNTKCTETIFVLEGQFIIQLGTNIFVVKKGDVFYLEPGNKYAISGKGINLVAVTPAWDSKQNKIIGA